jgi:hypothetical protein
MTIDRRSFTGKTSIESLGLTKEELEEELKQIMYVEKGVICSTLKIIGYYGT